MSIAWQQVDVDGDDFKDEEYEDEEVEELDDTADDGNWFHLLSARRVCNCFNSYCTGF